jgi:hypothetical protein
MFPKSPLPVKIAPTAADCGVRQLQLGNLLNRDVHDEDGVTRQERAASSRGRSAAPGDQRTTEFLPPERTGPQDDSAVRGWRRFRGRE